ncbi:MAG: hypothetical protein EP344_07985 [Bacteroidetes bacterium]|nr:MAG: hypothetical protein EP344_07985 [Bacteroidota bacterium]
MLYILFLAATVLGIMEIAYRYQWIDFYSTEWRALNPADQARQSNKKILVLGDSFSAQPFSYVQVLRDSLPACTIYNAAVGGTGIQEATAIARRRLAAVKPDLFVYQVYVGNDLWDLRKHTPGRVSGLRRLYWWMAERLLFLRYANYKSGQLKALAAAPATPMPELKDTSLVFSPERYSPREKMLLQADPGMIRHNILLSGGRDTDMEDWLTRVEKLFRSPELEHCPVLLVIVPHCAQTSAQWRARMETLGVSDLPPRISALSYPFLDRIRSYFGNNKQVRIISPLPEFQAAATAGTLLYYENDPHLTPAGHQLLGEILLEAMER